jgi:hypothetical protein
VGLQYVCNSDWRHNNHGHEGLCSKGVLKEQMKLLKNQNLFRVSDRPTYSAFPQLHVFHPVIDQRLQLCPQVCAMKHFLSNNGRCIMVSFGAIPSQSIETFLWSYTLHHQSSSVGKTNGVVWCIACQCKASV